MVPGKWCGGGDALHAKYTIFEAGWEEKNVHDFTVVQELRQLGWLLQPQQRALVDECVQHLIRTRRVAMLPKALEDGTAPIAITEGGGGPSSAPSSRGSSSIALVVAAPRFLEQSETPPTKHDLVVKGKTDTRSENILKMFQSRNM